MRHERRRVPFPDREDGRAFYTAFKELVVQLIRRVVDSHIPPENAHMFYHGSAWRQRRSDGTEMTSDVEAHTAETMLKFDDVVRGRLSAIPEQIQSILGQVESSFMKMFYARISEAVEQVGNVVDAKGKPPTETYIEMLQKIQFGVNRKGEVTRPQIHAHPNTAPKLHQALEQAGPEFHAEVDRLMAAKEAEALAREKERKARFKTWKGTE